MQIRSGVFPLGKFPLQSYGGSNFGLLNRNRLSPRTLLHDCATCDNDIRRELPPATALQ